MKKTIAAGLTDVGLKREHNEDAFLCDENLGLYIVADGMGGANAGEVASKAVVEVLPSMLKEKLKEIDNSDRRSLRRALVEIVRTLSSNLFERSQDVSSLKGLGTTAIALFIKNKTCFLVYSGDSRAYLLRKNKLIQLSEDQTLVAKLVSEGIIGPELAKTHPLRNSLDEFVGKEGKINPVVLSRKLKRKDRWLLCSDGLTKGVSDDEIYEMLNSSKEPGEVCKNLMDAALAAGGEDNISIIVVDAK